MATLRQSPPEPLLDALSKDRVYIIDDSDTECDTEYDTKRKIWDTSVDMDGSKRKQDDTAFGDESPKPQHTRDSENSNAASDLRQNSNLTNKNAPTTSINGDVGDKLQADAGMGDGGITLDDGVSQEVSPRSPPAASILTMRKLT